MKILQGTPTNQKEFSQLVLMSAPEFLPALYGERSPQLFEFLFAQEKNLFSFEHTHFAFVNKEIAGCILHYSGKTRKKESLRTGKLMLKFLGKEFLKKIPQMLKASRALGEVAPQQYYISNLAVYPQFRKKGVATQLLELAQEKAKQEGCRVLCLNVETENAPAINLYRKFGFKIVSEASVKIGPKIFSFYRMEKTI